MALRKTRLKKPRYAIAARLNYGKLADMECSNDTEVQALKVEHDHVAVKAAKGSST